MKITVKHLDTEITVSDSDSKDPASVRWRDQTDYVISVIKTIANQIVYINKATCKDA